VRSGQRVITIALLGLAMGAACGPSRVSGEASAQKVGDPVAYSFGSIDGELITSQGMLGRVTILLFGTSYDMVTQAVSKRLNQVLHAHSPRLNIALVLIEPPQNADMARAYRDLLGLDFPVALADSDPSV
jgi:hypothetical protein